MPPTIGLHRGRLPGTRQRLVESAHEAIRHVHSLLNTGHTEVIDADLSGYFDSIPHGDLMKSVARRVSDKQMLHLIKLWLVAPVEETDERGRKHRTTRNKDTGRGSPQGAPISPLMVGTTISELAGMTTQDRAGLNVLPGGTLIDELF